MLQPTTPDALPPDETDWPALPTETEIYILPDGRVIVADMPYELATLVEALGITEPCEVHGPPHDDLEE